MVLFVYRLFILITSGGVCKGLIAFALKTPLIKGSQSAFDRSTLSDFDSCHWLVALSGVFYVLRVNSLFTNEWQFWHDTLSHQTVPAVK